MDKLSKEDLQWLLELLAREHLAEISISSGDSEVVVKAATGVVSPAPAPVAPRPRAARKPRAAAPEPESGERLLSPMAGIFYRAPSPDSPAFAEVGDEVQAGDTVALIEAMKLFNEITSHVHGRIVRFLVENATHVEADQPLVIIERTGQ